MSDKIETVKIKSSHPKSQGDFVEINKSDFDPKKHTLFDAKDAPAPAPAPVVAPPAPAAVTPPPPAPMPAGTEDTADATGAVNATKKAVELAADAGLDLASVTGTGANGKITVEDVENAIDAMTAPVPVEGGQ